MDVRALGHKAGRLKGILGGLSFHFCKSFAIFSFYFRHFAVKLGFMLLRRCSAIIPRLGLFVIVLGSFAVVHGQSLEEQVRLAVEKTPHPNGAADFQTVPHLDCLNQGKTSICWSFATCSFVESEMARLKLAPVRLSVLYPAYCTYVEKSRRFVRTKGASRVNPGDLFMGVLETCQAYGAIPASVYGQPVPDKLLDNTRLDNELESLMKDVKRKGKWDEEAVLAQVKKVLDRHLGEPPKTFLFNGTAYTPQTFLAEVVRLPWKEYFMVTSFQYAPFNTFTELKVPDNWEHNTNFFNVPLPIFYEAFKGALGAGYSVAVSIDTSEPSYKITGKYCLVLESDVPATQLNQAAREARFKNGKTTDDHAVHFTGWKNVGGEDWFLAKDSWKTAWRDGNGGDLLVHSSYVKMKVLAFIVHREGVPGIVKSLNR
jgi:bleomycin hydrolase